MPASKVRKIDIVTVKKPKMRPRGKPFTADSPSAFTAETARAAQAKRKIFSGGSAKISVAYSMVLTAEMPDDIKAQLGIDPEQKCTWADAIGLQAAKRALGLVNSDKISHTAITELRETTEGKTPDKSEQSGPNGTPLVAPPPIQVNFIRPKKELPAEVVEDEKVDED